MDIIKINIIPPTYKNHILPANLNWITINSKPGKLNAEILESEISGLQTNINELMTKLSKIQKYKPKIKEIKEETIQFPENSTEKIPENDVIITVDIKEKQDEPQKDIEIIIPEEKRKKYQKSKRLCPCCNEIVIRHKCPHTACKSDCPIKNIKFKKIEKIK